MLKLKKIKVTKGVYWVEVPEVKLYILCGCPADSVKHLMKRGLIVNTEENGITFETGPSAILLSDVLLQHGNFANLAEFPVLQMLYRQGMILPNHPNNTGVRPMLIGSKEQVNAQMQYIYRGNYGLISEEEIIEGEIPSKIAKVMMELKLKFAFGKIRHTKELLDTLVVENEPVEIRNSVFIRRLRLNVYEFQYQENSITVDLNLLPHDRYEYPYPLGFYQINREYFGVIHSGEGDGWDINRPCMSSLLMFQGKIYLIDAGPNILNSLIALGININEIEGIFHTHSHDDHFAGLSNLIRSDHKIKYYATPLVRASVSKKLSALLSIEEESFTDYFEVHDLEFDVWNNIEGLEVKPLFSPHPVETNIFIFRALWEDGFRSYAHFADIVALDVLEGMIRKDKSEIGISQNYFEQIKGYYLTPAKLKKIDIGGGLIHGKAEDFQGDSSEKIILSHTSMELTVEQKNIGSGTTFGAVDILIPAYKNYEWKFAYQFLQSYFPTVPVSRLRILLNNEIITFNPESILLKEGVANEYIYLILTGNVEFIQSELGLYSLLPSGELVGEISGLLGAPAIATYRAASFVQAMRLHRKLYLEFVKQNKLYNEIKLLQENREFLQKNWLFGESISYPVQNKIAKTMKLHHYNAGELFSLWENNTLYVVKSGKLESFIDEDVFETLSFGNFFGEGSALFKIPSVFQIRAIEPIEVYQIPGNLLRDIPIVRWKTFEIFEKRMRLLDSELSSVPIFEWRDEYSANIQEMDIQHKKLFRMANELFKAIDSDKERYIIDIALKFLIQYSKTHFKEEEKLMKKYQFSEYKPHCKKHHDFIKHILGLKEQFKKRDIEMDMDLLDFFKEWIINHILNEDRKYGPFLNTKGLY